MEKEHGESEPKQEDFDFVLYREVGQFGKYQLLTIGLLAIPSLICAFMAGDYIFTAGSLPTRCAVPECDGLAPQYLPDWLSYAVPTTESGFDNCHRYANVSSAVISPDGLCSASLFDRDIIVPCDGYVYERTNTIVYDFNIECQEWLRTLPGTLNSAGGMVALILAGFISDRLGRRMSIVFFSFNIALVGVIRAFSVNFAMYTALQFMQTAIGGGAFSAAYILAAEIVGPQYRVRTSATISSMFALGQVVLGLLAYAIPAWKTLTLVLYVPVFLLVSYYWILSESFRWLLSENKQEEGKATLEYAARLNNKQISEKNMNFLLTTIHKQFWDTNCDTVRNLVGPVIFQRIAKIFDLPQEEKEYVPPEDVPLEVKSEDLFVSKASKGLFSAMGSEGEPSMEEEIQPEEESEWTVSTEHSHVSEEKRMKSLTSTRSLTVSKSVSKMLSKSFSRFLSKIMQSAKSAPEKLAAQKSSITIPDSLANTSDDMNVRPGTAMDVLYRRPRVGGNPFFDMLYCNESETDMIKWKSKYKQKTFEVSASDEFSKRAEILTKQVSLSRLLRFLEEHVLLRRIYIHSFRQTWSFRNNLDINENRSVGVPHERISSRNIVEDNY